jgi:energy-coupling factor transport system permease protein
MELIRYVPVGQYVPRASPLHALDPRTKIVATTVLMVVLFLAPSFAGLGLFVAAILMLLILGRIPIRFALQGLRPALFLVLLTVFLNTFFAGGDPTPELFRFGPLVATVGGLRNGLFVGARLLLLVALTSLLTFTTSPVELTHGLEALLRPFRRIGVPGNELAMMMSIALRFIPTLFEETERIIKAQMARGGSFDQGNVFRRAIAFVPVLVPLILSAFRRSEELAVAMEARCYSSGAHRTRMRELRLRTADAVATVVVVGAAAAVLLLR